MTAPTAAAAIFVLFDSTVASTIVSPFPIKITRMTGSTEGRVLGRGIHKRGGYDIAVARTTR